MTHGRLIGMVETPRCLGDGVESSGAVRRMNLGLGLGCMNTVSIRPGGERPRPASEPPRNPPR